MMGIIISSMFYYLIFEASEREIILRNPVATMIVGVTFQSWVARQPASVDCVFRVSVVDGFHFIIKINLCFFNGLLWVIKLY